LRTVNVPVAKCLPEAQAWSSVGVETSTYLVKVRS
jgi:hypothetical protein